MSATTMISLFQEYPIYLCLAVSVAFQLVSSLYFMSR